MYTFATLQNALDALDARLYDSTNGVGFQFWSQAELTACIIESLRTFNALSGFWRAEMTFNLVPNQWWYDLTAQAGSLVPYTVSQIDIVQMIQYHLLEPPSASYPLVWSGSTQFSLSDILQALQRRQDDTLGTTACVINQAFVAANLVPRTFLPDTTVDIRRIAWIPQTGLGYTAHPMNESDEWAQRAFNPNFTTSPARPPDTWMQNTQPPPSFDVDAVPPVAGQYDVLTVESGPTWSDVTGALMGMPDDWSWVVKWGALADLLSRESPAKDALRADYCKARYEEGLALLENAPLMLGCRINNLPVSVSAPVQGDAYNPLWQAAAAAQPDSVYTARNMIGFGPKPNMAYAVTISVCQNAPVPTVAGDFIQIARDCYDSILDIAQHLAAFKMGGAEFIATIPLYKKAQMKAAQYNGKLREMGFFSFPQADISQLQEQQADRYLAGSGPGSQ